MFCVLAAPSAKLSEFYFALNRFLIFPRPIADSLTALTLKFYEVILGHRDMLPDLR